LLSRFAFGLNSGKSCDGDVQSCDRHIQKITIIFFKFFKPKWSYPLELPLSNRTFLGFVLVDPFHGRDDF